MNRIDLLVRANVRALVPYSSARDEYEGKEGIFLDANESPFGPLNRYPDPRQRDLRAAISKLRGIAEENIFLGNGSDEVIDLCYRIFCNPGTDRAVIFPPTYGMYGVSAAINDVEVIKVPLDENFGLDIPAITPLLTDDRIKLIFICSPNNPTGNSMDAESIEFIIRNFQGIVVIDEAYVDFGAESAVQLVNQYDNLVVCQTTSKSRSLAGLRVGFAIAQSHLIAALEAVKNSFNSYPMDRFAIAAAVASFEDQVYFEAQCAKVIESREKLVGDLTALGFKVLPSKANFIFATHPQHQAAQLAQQLREQGIIVRYFNKPRIDQFLRITIGTDEQNQRLVDTLKMQIL